MAMFSSSSTQQPAAICALKSPGDAIHILEAVRLGIVPRVTRRLTGHERSMIRPGTVWVWEEEETNMRRWTDGRRWGASRVGGGGFLVYTESSDSLSPPPSRPDSPGYPQSGYYPPAGGSSSASPMRRPEPLVKQTYSTSMTHPVTAKVKKFHVVAYSSKRNPQGDGQNALPLPHQLPNLANIKVTPGIWPDWETRREEFGRRQPSVAAHTPHPVAPAPPHHGHGHGVHHVAGGHPAHASHSHAAHPSHPVHHPAHLAASGPATPVTATAGPYPHPDSYRPSSRDLGAHPGHYPPPPPGERRGATPEHEARRYPSHPYYDPYDHHRAPYPPHYPERYPHAPDRYAPPPQERYHHAPAPYPYLTQRSRGSGGGNVGGGPVSGPGGETLPSPDPSAVPQGNLPPPPPSPADYRYNERYYEHRERELEREHHERAAAVSRGRERGDEPPVAAPPASGPPVTVPTSVRRSPPRYYPYTYYREPYPPRDPRDPREYHDGHLYERDPRDPRDPRDLRDHRERPVQTYPPPPPPVQIQQHHTGKRSPSTRPGFEEGGGDPKRPTWDSPRSPTDIRSLAPPERSPLERDRSPLLPQRHMDTTSRERERPSPAHAAEAAAQRHPDSRERERDRIPSDSSHRRVPSDSSHVSEQVKTSPRENPNDAATENSPSRTGGAGGGVTLPPLRVAIEIEEKSSANRERVSPRAPSDGGWGRVPA